MIEKVSHSIRRLLLHTVALVLTACPVLLMSGCSGSSSGDIPAPEDLLVSRVRSVDKLLLAQMRISKMATVGDVSLSDARNAREAARAVLDAVKIGDRKAAYSYDTYMQAYINLSQLTPEDITFDRDNHTAVIVLPEIQTEFAGRDAGIREDHYRVTGLRSEISAEERAAVKEKIATRLREEVRKDDSFRRLLTDKARNRATTYFTELFASRGYKVEVKFR